MWDVGDLGHCRSGCIICICPGDELCKVLRSQPPSDMTVTIEAVGKGMWTVFPECLVTPHMVLLPLTWPSISQTRGYTCLKWCFSIDHCCKWYMVPLGYSWWILHNGCHNSQTLHSDMYLTCRLQSCICTLHRYKIVTRYMCIFSTWKNLSTLK